MSTESLPRTKDPYHVRLMKLALSEAQKCIATPTAFCVGAIITSSSGTILSSGYSRELPGNTHAEQCAIDKIGSPIASRPLLEGASLYTTMEPCSERLSGNEPCAQRILKTPIKTVYIGVLEPKDFVADCQGVKLLLDDGRQVFVVDDAELAQECLREARRGH
ncbi:hypothetical protein OIO90_000036 [Microbotryomycetes sp. JL221]|nr:hypothetical protein OIO90_000036 [Microbotryomycetes sp. JL221]